MGPGRSETTRRDAFPIRRSSRQPVTCSASWRVGIAISLSAATAAFVVDVLAANGSPDVAWMNRLFEDRKKLPLFGEAMLLHAMAISKGDAKAMQEMMREIDGHIRLDGPVARAVDNTGDNYAALMDSEARTTALVLRGLLAATPSHPMAARIAKGLLADRKGGTWRSTQETAWALLSLDDYRRAQEKAEPSFDARAFLGNAEILTAAFHGRSAASQTGKRACRAHSGQRRLDACVRARWFRAALLRSAASLREKGAAQRPARPRVLREESDALGAPRTARHRGDDRPHGVRVELCRWRSGARRSGRRGTVASGVRGDRRSSAGGARAGRRATRDHRSIARRRQRGRAGNR